MTGDAGATGVDTILAFAFGNRLVPGRGGLLEPRPGPVNEALADVVLKLHSTSGALVLAQWEIASVLGLHGALADDMLHSIRPSGDRNGEVRYLSTRGVVETAVQIGRGAAALGRVLVVAHRDHIDRCVRLCREASVDASGPDGLQRQWLPSFYDSQSGQPWTRSREDYLRHEKTMASPGR